MEERYKNLPINGKLIQEKGLLCSIELGHDNFQASNGWLDSWQKRHNVKFNTLSGEAADVPVEVCDDWTRRLPELCEGYDPKDIFNCDETGLLFRAMPTKLFKKKGATCSGGKKSKDRITVLFTCSAIGEKLKSLVIGKSANPRCFKGCKHLLPVKYTANRKAWMNTREF